MAVDISELPDVPRRRDISFWAVLLVVCPLYCSVPSAWLFVAYTLRTGRPYSWTFFLALSEVVFSVYHFHLAKHVSRPLDASHGDLAEIQLAYQRILKSGLANSADGYDEETIVPLEPDDPRAVDFRNTLRTWFGRVAWSEVRLHEARQWIYWSIFNKDLPDLQTLPPAHRAVLDDSLDLLQKRLGKKIPEGSAPHARPMRLALDEYHIEVRPLCFYVLTAVGNICLDWWYKTQDFKRGNHDGLEYLVRIPSAWDSTQGPRPMVFIHGLGLGLLQYHSFLSTLALEFTDRPLFILLQPHVSQNIFHPRFLNPMNRKQTVARLAELMASFDWVDLEPPATKSDVEMKDVDDLNDKPLRRKGVTMLSHSNGSFCHAWMLKDCSHMVTRSCFVDPVTFCGWEGDLLRNFFYKTSCTGAELLVRYFVGTELGVVNFLQRNFDWSSNSLWYEEIPNARDPSKAIFLMGDLDSIANVPRVKRYLRSHGIRKGIWCDPNGHHGQALLAGGEGCKVVYEWLRESEV